MNTPEKIQEIIKVPLREEIGEGSFGKVYKVLYKGKPYAIKRIKIYDKNNAYEKESLLKEVSIHKELSLHPSTQEHVPIFYGSYTKGSYFYIVMEYLQGMDIATFCKSSKIPKEVLDTILSQIETILKKFHALDIVFNDLYTNNIYLQLKENGLFQVKLFDFGMAHKEGNIMEQETGEVAKKTNNWKQFEKLKQSISYCEKPNRNNTTQSRKKPIRFGKKTRSNRKN